MKKGGNNMGNVWFSSDFHLGHKNLVRGETEWERDSLEACRDFDTLEEHDEKLLENINGSIKKKDFLYFLGDFSFGGVDNIYKYRKRINCDNIHMVLGNHDHFLRKNKIIATDEGYMNVQNLFLSCTEVIEKKIGKNQFFMFHYPVYSWHKYRTAIHVYGHTHKELNYSDKAICVCIDSHPEFRPYHIEEIRETYNKNN